MDQYIADTQVKKDNIAVSGFSFEDDQEVRVIVSPDHV